MRNVMMKISALLLVVWYCMSIIGFDVHTCQGSGETFFVTVLQGTDCADIHPDHGCAHAGHHCCACSHHCDADHHQEDGCLTDDGCCSDDIKVLAFTGSRVDDEVRQLQAPVFSCAEIISLESVCAASCCEVRASSINPDSGLIVVPGDVQSVLSIWRI